MNKFLSTILIIGLIILTGFIGFSLVSFPREVNFELNPEIKEPVLNVPKQKEKTEDSKITLIAVGDIMLDRGVEYKVEKQGKDDFRFPFLRIAEDLKKADILFGNLEGPISDKGKKVGSIYSFRAEPEAVEGLVAAGFDVLSLANNHMFDYQRLALEDTMKILKENKIDYAGAGFNEEEAYSVTIKETKGTRIGFFAYTNLGPEIWKATKENSGIAWISEDNFEKIKKDIKAAKEKVDVLVVSLHSGEEYKIEPTNFQKKFSKLVIDAGADLVIGHHPHIIQPIEKYTENPAPSAKEGGNGTGRNGWIAYSLGNFVFDQSFSEETMEGCLLKVTIEQGKIKEVVPQKIKISRSFQPYFAKQGYIKSFMAQKIEALSSSKTSFLEVNLPEMKIKIYQDGVFAEQVPILAKGDPNLWAGVPSGLYQVISKRKLAFSSTADVYMPWSVNFYGKYYIHGQPYNTEGQSTDFEYTGGCIRLSNKDAKIVYDSAEKGMPILVVAKEFQNYDYNPASQNSQNIELIPGVSAESYLIADLDSGFIFSEKISQKHLPIASLTKLMTAIVVAENIDLRSSILIRPEMLKVYGSTKGLRAGKRFRVVELFYPLLIESSNDAAQTLSYFLGRKKTIELMNEKAESIGMEKTKFVEPTGLDKENVSTAQDLFYLARYLLNIRSPILKITKEEEVPSFGAVRFKDLSNKNIFPKSADFLGGKTGFILASKYVGLFIFQLPLPDGTSRNVLITLLKSNNLEKDTARILTWWFNKNYLD